ARPSGRNQNRLLRVLRPSEPHHSAAQPQPKADSSLRCAPLRMTCHPERSEGSAFLRATRRSSPLVLQRSLRTRSAGAETVRKKLQNKPSSFQFRVSNFQFTVPSFGVQEERLRLARSFNAGDCRPPQPPEREVVLNNSRRPRSAGCTRARGSRPSR